ncbi:MAG: hypothetical protein M1830_006397 [Pleopsidium flavum]|nr:MAG: hypothetical protein M1830_006397 [Pleopsidium flavum]
MENACFNNHTIGFRTSVDLAQKQTFNTSPIAGSKRSHAQIFGQNSVSNGSVLADRTNICLGNSFQRPTVSSSGKPRLQASEIRSVSSTGSQTCVFSEYSQRKALAATPGPTQSPLLSLSHPQYGLPETLVRNFSSLGINAIYPWQSSCLLGRGILSGEKNLVYTAPTGGGKSLVADVILLRRVINDPTKKAILVLPYVALVQEKLKWLRRVVDGVRKDVDSATQEVEQIPKWKKRSDHRSVRVVGFFGGSKARATWADVDIAVCTIEKANSLVNTAIEESTIGDLGVVVMDELHMLDDDHRGYILELMATKILSLQQEVQVVGMSATLSNTELLAKWLDAKYYQSKYRPVPIEEYLVYDNSIYAASTSSAFFKTASQLNSTHQKPSTLPSRSILPSDLKELQKPVINAVVSLAIETVRAGYGALVFCSGRQGCQVDALIISEAMPAANETSTDVLDRRKQAMTELRSLPVGLDPVLEKTIPRGVAFHHAGLTTEERDIVAEAYDQGVLKVIVATCSLAAGINLPARRVILHGARMGRDLVGPAMLRQMRGRAGRKGKDEVGESYLCCEKTDLEAVTQLLEAELPPVESCLTPDKRGIKRCYLSQDQEISLTSHRALLEVIAIRLAVHADAVNDYIKRTLLYHTMSKDDLRAMVKLTIEDLLASNLISMDRTGSYEASLLSQAIVASSLTPDDGIFVHDEIQRALRAFVMDGEMHIFYMFTPVQSIGLADINWPIFRTEMEGLDESGLRVLKYVGINPRFVNEMGNSGKPLPERSPTEITTARIYRRFYAAFQLRDLSNELPIHAVAKKYDTPRGFVQNLAQTCHGFAAGMIKFCERMGWGMLTAVLEHMSDRLKAGAKADLLQLARVAYVKSRTARVFWENGFKSVRAVAEAEAKDLVPILMLAQPKKSKIQGDEEEKYQLKMMVKAEIIVASANRLWEKQQDIEVEGEL